MRKILLALILGVLAAAAVHGAEPQTITITVTTAQNAANETARRGILGHCTRRPGGIVEGVGFSPNDPDEAIRRSCFWGKRRVREIGVARGPRGWYAVVWYF